MSLSFLSPLLVPMLAMPVGVVSAVTMAVFLHSVLVAMAPESLPLAVVVVSVVAMVTVPMSTPSNPTLIQYVITTSLLYNGTIARQNETPTNRNGFAHQKAIFSADQ